MANITKDTLKAELDEKGIAYKETDSKAKLEALLEEGATPAAEGDEPSEEVVDEIVDDEVDPAAEGDDDEDDDEDIPVVSKKSKGVLGPDDEGRSVGPDLSGIKAPKTSSSHAKVLDKRTGSPVRVYTKKDHGKDFAKLAQMYCEKLNSKKLAKHPGYVVK